MITAKEWAFATTIVPGQETVKDKEAKLVAQETREYFANGGIMTRREKDGGLSFWAMRDEKLTRIPLKDATAIKKAQREAKTAE